MVVEDQDFLDDLYKKEKEELGIRRFVLLKKYLNRKYFFMNFNFFQKENMKTLLWRYDITSWLKWEECVQMYKDDPIFNSLKNYDQLT